MHETVLSHHINQIYSMLVNAVVKRDPQRQKGHISIFERWGFQTPPKTRVSNGQPSPRHPSPAVAQPPFPTIALWMTFQKTMFLFLLSPCCCLMKV